MIFMLTLCIFSPQALFFTSFFFFFFNLNAKCDGKTSNVLSISFACTRLHLNLCKVRNVEEQDPSNFTNLCVHHSK
jgi:hypothetical protein